MDEKLNLDQAKKILGEDFISDSDFLSFVVTNLRLAKNSKVLDVGTGRGYMAMILALHGYKVITGEPEGVYWADWRSSVKKINVDDMITFQTLNAEKLSYDNMFFDAVFLYSTFHHINNKELAINELFRVIKHKGILVIIEPTDKGVELLRKRYMYHQDAVDPRDYTKNLGFKAEIIESKFLNAYIFKK